MLRPEEERQRGLGYSEIEPPFNHNYSNMPKINTSVDDLLLKSGRRHELNTSSRKLGSLIVNPILSDLNHSDDSEVCAEGLSVCRQSEEKEEISVGRNIDCSVSSNKSQFSVPKVCRYAYGRPSNISRHCLHTPTEFFYGKNHKVTPKAKPVSKPLRTLQSSKTKVKPQRKN
ncbi:hypothetical protein R6Q57_008355 [Mikania cordata]